MNNYAAEPSQLTAFIPRSRSIHRQFLLLPHSKGTMATYDTLILSDLHLGSGVSRANDAIHLLHTQPFSQLILLGDIFANLNFSRLTKDHWKFLSAIRKLSNPKRKVKVIWVEGNHDLGLSNIMSHLVGIPVYQRYVWEYDGMRHLAIHGHQFDRFISRNVFLSRFFESFYCTVQKLDSKNKTISRWLDRFSTRWLRLSDKVERGAIAYARAGHIDRVFCGHTHQAASAIHPDVAYFNTGSWVDHNATYITINQQGVEIHAYQSRTDHHHSVEERDPLAATPPDLFERAGLPAYAGYESLRC